MNLSKTLLIAAILIALAGFVFVYTGLYNVAADKPHLSATRWLLQTIRNRSIATRLDSITVPENLEREDLIRRGGELYGAMCQGCHLGPGMSPTALNKGLNPKPPRLEDHTAHHSLKKQFWIVKHGIKMTGMPAWGETHTDDALWDVIAFVSQLPTMTPEAFQDYTTAVQN
jgi:mono/diheme cytochrome c family protein